MQKSRLSNVLHFKFPMKRHYKDNFNNNWDNILVPHVFNMNCRCGRIFHTIFPQILSSLFSYDNLVTYCFRVFVTYSLLER